MTDASAADSEKLLGIFHPHALEPIKRIRSQGARFAHYTTVDGALGILRDKCLWMRKASCMADFMEINFGTNCLVDTYRGATGTRLKKLLDDTFPAFTPKFEALFNSWLPHFRDDTYLASVSEHLDEEDRHGRLSMWRAFGPGAVGIALVFKGEPFGRDATNLAVYSSPVSYLRSDEFPVAFERLLKGIEENLDFLRAEGPDQVSNWLFHAFRLTCLCAKHRGFQEEREWRIYYSPKIEASKYVKKSTRVIRGVPQPIFELQLKNNPDDGVVGIGLTDLFDRLLIGPTQYPDAVFEAFTEELTAAGIADAEKKIFVSDIPIRTQS